jgi:hypothetical protein
MRAWVVGLASVALACGSECKTGTCAKVDLEPGAADDVIALDTDSAFVHFVIDGIGSDQGLAGGEVVVEPEDASCVASADHPCAIVLKRLRVRLSSATLSTSEGDVSLVDPVVAVKAPLALVDSGSGFFVPHGTEAETCVSVDGRADAETAPLVGDPAMIIDFERQSFSLQGTFPVRFHIQGGECKAFAATATVVASGRTPWTTPL